MTLATIHRVSKMSFITNRMICVLLVLFLHLQNGHICNSANPVCQTNECRHYADTLKKTMKESAKPCVDFHSYVCGGWAALNPKPPHENTWTIERSMQYRVSRELKQLLEDNKQSANPQFEYAKDLYRACMTLPYMGQVRTSDLKNNIIAAGTWPMFQLRTNEGITTWSQLDNQYATKTGEATFYDYHFVFDVKKRKNVIALSHPISAYGMLTHGQAWNPGEMRHYVEFLNEVLKTIALKPTPAKKDDINAILKFRESLNRKIDEAVDYEEEKGKLQVFETMTIGQFQKVYNTAAKSHQSAQINWLDTISSVFKNSKIPITASTEIMVETDYFLDLAGVLAATSLDVLLNHINLYFAERHVELSPSMETNLQKSFTDGPSATGDIRYPVDRWQTCIQSHNLKTTLSKMYIDAYFPVKSKNDVENLFEVAKATLKKEIMESNWLNSSTITATIQKLNSIQSQVGYPDWMVSNRVVIHADEDIDPLEPTAYFTYKKNTLHVSAAYLQSPLYTPNLPYEITYGSLMSMLGHELHHAFTQKGLKFDQHGDPNLLWPMNTYQKFLERMQCFYDMYGDYRKNELEAITSAKRPDDDDLPSTTDEDMPDVMGLKLSYRAFKEKMDQEKGKCPVLPGFENFSCEKLFFISFASTFCANLTPADKVYLLLNDKHSLPRIRVNGAVSNMPEFGEAFKCGTKDPLKSKKSCDTWNK